MESEKPKVDRWLVLRDLSRPNAKNPAYKALQSMPGMEEDLFIPMKRQAYVQGGKRLVREVPYMYDLIFVRRTREELDMLLVKLPGLQYRYRRGCKITDTLSVADAEMSRFKKAVESADIVEYFTPAEVPLELYGKKIRIVGGKLDGITGRLMTKQGSKVKRLIIDLEECSLSAAVQVESEYIQLVK